MEQIKIENGIIVDHIGSPRHFEGYQIVNNFMGEVGDPIKWYDNKFRKYPEPYLYEKGLKEPPKGFYFDGKELRQMTQAERIEAGIEELPKGQKIEGGEVVPMTRDEMIAAGQISAEDQAEFIRGQRDAILNATDKYLLPDFPITELDRAKIKVYRQELRDLPKVKNFPFVAVPSIPILK